MDAALTPHLAPAVEDESRSARKRREILEAARTLFLRDGYLATSMDEVAALAAVSKQTVYKHFADKERLFRQIVIGTVDDANDPNHDELLGLRDSADIEVDLRQLARRQLDRVMQPQLVQLRRLVIGENGRFPELGRIFYERGVGRTVHALSHAFAGLAERGVLRLEDPETAAAHFSWLIMSAPVNRAMMLGDDEIPGPAELGRYADEGVRVFLAAYGPR